MSQPGTEYKIEMYQNHYDYMANMANIDPNYKFLDGNYKKKQRACVSGLMLKSKSIEVYNQMSKNSNYIISLSCMDNDISEDLSICSMPFKDELAMYGELKLHNNLIEQQFTNKLFDNDEFKKIPYIPVKYTKNIL
jgi:hypothetical protein